MKEQIEVKEHPEVHKCTLKKWQKILKSIDPIQYKRFVEGEWIATNGKATLIDYSYENPKE